MRDLHRKLNVITQLSPATPFIDQKAYPFENFRMMFGQPTGTKEATGLLIGGRDKPDIPV